MYSNKQKIEKIYTFLHSCPLAVVSTLSSAENKPESALIAFAETKKLQLIFETFENSRKYANLLLNPTVLFVMGVG